MANTVAFYPASHARRAVTVVRDGSKPADMRYEVIYQTGRRENPVAWAFCRTRAEADRLAQEVR